MLSADRLEVQTEELRRVLLGGPEVGRDKEEEDENVEMLIEEWMMKVFPLLPLTSLQYSWSVDCYCYCTVPVLLCCVVLCHV
jgi:hypothetical protein